MGKIVRIKDQNNVDVFPLTHERGVRDSSGVTLETKLAQLVGSADIDIIEELTQTEYDALATKDARTMYIVSNSTIPSDHVGIASFAQTTTSNVDGGTNVWTVTLTNGQTFTLQVKNGNQGNSGYSGAAGELEVVNNLTQGGATAALSAEMGKTLEGEISQLGLEVTELEDAVEIRVEDITTFYNGTVNNAGNQNCVRTAKIPVVAGKTYRFVTNRPTPEGYKYDFGYATYSSMDSDIGATNRIRNIDPESSIARDSDFTIVEGEIALVYVIGMVKNGARSPLRYDSFDGYTCRAVREDTLISDHTAQIEDLKAEITGQGCNYSYGFYLYPNNASGGDSGSGITAYIPAKNGDVVEWHHGYTTTGNKSLLVYDSNKAFISGKSWTVNAVTSRTLTLNDSSIAYIRASFNLSADAYIAINGTVVWRKQDGYIGIKKDVNNIYELLGANGITCFAMNGTTSNAGNTNFVHTDKIQVDAGKTYKFYTDRPLPDGHRYIYGYSTYPTSDYGSWHLNRIRNIDINQSNPIFDSTVTINASESAVVFMVGVLDNEGVVVPLRAEDFIGSTCILYEKSAVEDLLENLNDPAVISLNKERSIALAAICRLNKFTTTPHQDIELIISTDEHNDSSSAQRAIDAANGFPTIDAYINCGDIMSGYFSESEVANYQSRFAKLTKPGYVVVGNHDVGNVSYVGVGATHQQAYNAFIKPMVDKGWLSAGEYIENLPYWYHDISTYKVRLIGLYEYDGDLILSDNNYWEPVAYDSTAAEIAFNHAYSVGDVIKCGTYTDYCFRCKSAVTTPANYYSGDTSGIPNYKVARGMRVVREAQANWFLDTLASTPADYGVIVIMHNPFSDMAETVECKFSQNHGVLGSEYSQNSMSTDFIADAVAAFKDGISYSANVAMKGAAAYMNTQGGGTYAYSVSKNFSSKNSGAYLLGFLGGHSHRDLVWKKNNLYQVTPICTSNQVIQSTSSDIRRTVASSEITDDCLTVVSFANGRIGLAKLGVNVTENGTPRDYEVINTSE